MQLFCGPHLQKCKKSRICILNLKVFLALLDSLMAHIFQLPSERGIDYYNRKDFYSIVLQAVVREDLRFIDIFAGFPGKVHDARVFRHSKLFENGPELCGDGHLFGDSSYPNCSWLLTPFRYNGHLTEVQTHYNYTHSSIRSTVERAFGLLKGRFTRLKYLDQNDTKLMV